MVGLPPKLPLFSRGDGKERDERGKRVALEEEEDEEEEEAVPSFNHAPPPPPPPPAARDGSK